MSEPIQKQAFSPMPEGLRNILRFRLEEARQPLPELCRKYPMQVMLHAENLKRWEDYNEWADSLPNATTTTGGNRNE